MVIWATKIHLFVTESKSFKIRLIHKRKFWEITKKDWVHWKKTESIVFYCNPTLYNDWNTDKTSFFADFCIFLCRFNDRIDNKKTQFFKILEKVSFETYVLNDILLDFFPLKCMFKYTGSI